MLALSQKLKEANIQNNLTLNDILWLAWLYVVDCQTAFNYIIDYTWIIEYVDEEDLPPNVGDNSLY